MNVEPSIFETAPDPAVFGSIFDEVAEARRADGFTGGYRRAVNDIIGELLLIAEQVIRDRPDASAETREAVRDFRRRLEARLDGSVDTSGDDLRAERFDVEDGLGI